jgi:sulfopropanediol 3-dehydrogenase
VAEYLKRAQVPPVQAGDEVRETVARMLADIEHRGAEAVRDHSRVLDGWAPPTFLVGEDEIEHADAALPAELKEHMAFAQERVRDFAERQLATLDDLQVETLRGVRLGHRHVPVDAVGAMCRAAAIRCWRRRS